MSNEVQEFLQNPNRYDPETLKAFWDWATSPEVEESGIGRWQLGFEDGIAGMAPGSRNSQYLDGWQAGQACKM